MMPVTLILLITAQRSQIVVIMLIATVVHPRKSVPGVHRRTFAHHNLKCIPWTAEVSCSIFPALAITLQVFVSKMLFLYLFKHNVLFFNLENVIVGNLVIRADPTFGGGELNISGPAFNLKLSKQCNLFL